MLIFVLPHQFLSRMLPTISKVITPDAKAISLIKVRSTGGFAVHAHAQIWHRRMYIPPALALSWVKVLDLLFRNSLAISSLSSSAMSRLITDMRGVRPSYVSASEARDEEILHGHNHCVIMHTSCPCVTHVVSMNVRAEVIVSATIDTNTPTHKTMCIRVCVYHKTKTSLHT